MTLLALILKSSMYVQKFENKNCGSFYIFLLYTLISTLIFHFHQLHFKNKILLRIANIYDGLYTDINSQKVVQKITDIVGNISFVPLIA